MEFSSHEPDPQESDAVFRRACEINAQIVTACGFALDFHDLFEGQSTLAYKDEEFFGIAQLDHSNTMVQSEKARRVQLGVATRRAMLTNAVVQATEDLIKARKEIVLEYASCHSSITEASSIPPDTGLIHLLRPQELLSVKAPIDSDESDRIQDVALAEYIAHFTNDVETALTIVNRHQRIADAWVWRVETSRLTMEEERAQAPSLEGRHIAGAHIRIQKAVADLAVHDAGLYKERIADLCAERDDRYFAARMAYFSGNDHEVIAREPDDMISFFVQASQYDNDTAQGA